MKSTDIGSLGEGPVVNQNDNPISEVIHFFEKQLPYIPKLSFLEYSDILERGYKFSSRTMY